MSASWRPVWSYLVATRRSCWAFLVTMLLGLLSMGLLGGALYYGVGFALPAAYPSIDDLHGDWVWPAFIAVGMGWSLGFLQAGALNLRLGRHSVAAGWRHLVYGLVLWAWAWLLWFLTLAQH